AIYDHFGAQMPVSIHDRCSLVRSLAELGRFPAATKYADEAISLAVRAKQLYTDAVVHDFAAFRYLLQGEWPKALSMSERLTATSRTGNFGLFLPVGVAFSAMAQAQLGRRVAAQTGGNRCGRRCRRLPPDGARRERDAGALAQEPF